MRTLFKTVVCLGIILCWALFSSRYALADDSLKKTKSEVEEYYYMKDYSGYRYPILPETVDWPYGNHQDMVNVSQIPKSVYEAMSTDELLQSVLDYPLISDILAYDDFDIGYKVVKEHFGALEELSKREDNGDCLKNLQKIYIEAELHPQNHELEDLENLEKRKNRDFVRKMVLGILSRQEDFSGDRLGVYTENDNKSIRKDIYYTANGIGNIVRAIRDYFIAIFNTFEIGSITVATPRGGSMTGFIRVVTEQWHCTDGTVGYFTFSDFSDEAKAGLNSAMYSTYGLNPDPTYGPSVRYNCHSYAWYKHVNCDYWINQFNTYGYTQVSWQNVNTGGIAVYYNTYGGGMGPTAQYTHSAIVLANTYGLLPQENNILRSKWGECAMYTHIMSNCPYYYIFYPPMSQPQGCDIVYYN